jgi:hypothetical protein
VALDKNIRKYLAAIGRKGGRKRMKRVTSEQQAAFARVRWKGMSRQERSRAAARGWGMRRARQKSPASRS